MAIFCRCNAEIKDDKGPKGRRQSRFMAPKIHIAAHLMDRFALAAANLFKGVPHAWLKPHARPMTGDRYVAIDQCACHF